MAGKPTVAPVPPSFTVRLPAMGNGGKIAGRLKSAAGPN